MSLQQVAEENWPEDEARLAAEFALALYETEGRDYYHQWLIKERSCVIHNVFDDDQVLIDRFETEFNRLTTPTTNLYF
jgi:hypothetical protein